MRLGVKRSIKFHTRTDADLLRVGVGTHSPSSLVPDNSKKSVISNEMELFITSFA